MLIFNLILFSISSIILFRASAWLVEDLVKLAYLLKWREFVVAFFVMAFAGGLPNFFVGINSVLHKIPQLSLGDVVGGNVVDLTLVVGLAVLIAKRNIEAESRMVQTSAIFTTVIAILPLILLLDGNLNRGDGVLLIFTFFLYIFWLFSKEERFKKIYSLPKTQQNIWNFKNFFKALGRTIFSTFLLLLSAEGIVRSASFFAQKFGISLGTIGILVVGLGNALPEMHFSIACAKRGQSWMILGNLMGNVIIPATLVLGIVSLLSPIYIENTSPFWVGRIFLMITALFFLFTVRTGEEITKKEALILLFLYLMFLGIEILIK